MYKGSGKILLTLLVLIGIISSAITVEANSTTVNHPVITVYNKTTGHTITMETNVVTLLRVNESHELITLGINSSNYTSAAFYNTNSPNWAGYVIRNYVTDVNSSWRVQPVIATVDQRYSAQWVGIGGIPSLAHGVFDRTLIQIGTESDSGLFGTNYYAWFECTGEYACNSSKGTQNATFEILPIHANDTMHAEIKLINKTENVWFIGISDITEGWHFSENVIYNSSEYHADFIEERLTFNHTFGGGALPTLANFSLAAYGNDFTNISGTSYVTVNGTSTPISISDAGITSDVVKYSINASNNKILATPDPITPDGTSFGVTYGNLSVRALPNKTIAHFGDKISITAKPLGGTGQYSYQWYTANQSFGLTSLHFNL